MAITLFALTRGDETIRVVMDRLRSAGIPPERLSVMYPDPAARTGDDAAPRADAPARPGAGEGMVGGAIGLGLLMGIGALGVPAIGPFLAAGPILAALSVPNAGATLGALATWLTGFGIAEPEARRFETSLREGTALIAVHDLGIEDVARVRDILARAGVTDILQSGDVQEPGSTAPAHAGAPFTETGRGG